MIQQRCAMQSTRNLLIGLVIVTVVAGGLRFYRIGAWSFDVDEIASLLEDRLLFDGIPPTDDAKGEGQYTHLPQMLPLGYGLQHIDYLLFGRGEGGSRVVPAAMGTITAALTYLLLVPLCGLPTAFATALLIAVSPEHIHYSQNNRFYAAATFFAFLCVLGGAWVVDGTQLDRPQRFWGAVLAPLFVSLFAVAALLCHSVAAGAFGMALFGISAAVLARRHAIPLTTCLPLFGGAVVLVAIAIGHVLPLAHGWNESAEWGDSPVSAVVGTVYRLGWPLVLLAVLGAALIIRSGFACAWYWVACSVGLLAIVYIAPFKMVYVARYGLPLTLPVFVLAGMAIAQTYGMFRAHNKVAAVAWICVVFMLGAPSLASYYADGSRPDLQSALAFVAKSWRPGDCVCYIGRQKRALDYYIPTCTPSYSLTVESVKQLEDITCMHQRVWVVCTGYRRSAQNNIESWLGKRCSHELHVEAPRYDYYQNIVNVFLFDQGNPRVPLTDNSNCYVNTLDQQGGLNSSFVLALKQANAVRFGGGFFKVGDGGNASRRTLVGRLREGVVVSVQASVVVFLR